MRRLRFPDWPPISWGTVFLAVMVGVLGLVYWQDHNRWGDYLGCARDQASAAVVRSGPAAELNNAQSHSTQANQRVLHVLGVIADFSRSHQGEQNPSDQVTASLGTCPSSTTGIMNLSLLASDCSSRWSQLFAVSGNST